MFGKSKDENEPVPSAVQQLQRPAATTPTEQGSNDQGSSISRGMMIVGKVVGEGTVHVFGQIEGELRATRIFIDEGAKVDGDVVAEELTIGGEVRGTIHASRVRLNTTAVVEGDIFHRSLSIEENARFEGSSKREDSAADFPRTPRAAIQDNLPTTVAATQGTRKTNGAPSHDGHSAAGET
jgi:cytoskeletal protein CcmA (bactofilin family)